MKLIFEMHKYLKIVLDNELNLISLNDDERFVESIDECLKTYIIFWEIYHVFAREILLKYLESTDLLKIFSYKQNISTI